MNDGFPRGEDQSETQAIAPAVDGGRPRHPDHTLGYEP